MFAGPVVFTVHSTERPVVVLTVHSPGTVVVATVHSARPVVVLIVHSAGLVVMLTVHSAGPVVVLIVHSAGKIVVLVVHSTGPVQGRAQGGGRKGCACDPRGPHKRNRHVQNTNSDSLSSFQRNKVSQAITPFV